jgi:hypothetical protein
MKDQLGIGFFQLAMVQRGEQYDSSPRAVAFISGH